MRLSYLGVRHFRNLAALDLDVPAGGMVVVGDNGQGKTNLLEAIHYLVLFRSFRGAADRDLVAFGEPGFHVTASVANGSGSSRVVAAGFDLRQSKKRVTLDHAESQRLSGALGAVRAVVLSPSDRELVAGSPPGRRRFLDVILSLTESGYLDALRRYGHALKQRNAALRRERPEEARVFEPALSTAGATVTEARRQWVEARSARFNSLVERLGETGALDVAYRGASATVDYAATRGRDLARGTTGEGPHREDLELTLDGRSLGVFGSSGQQRTAATALRLLESDALGEPVLLLDDAFAELDPERRDRLATLLAGRQRVLAVPTEADVPPEAAALPRWRISRGTVEVV